MSLTLKPVHIAQSPFFYAAGNTPAVCLTQSLPPEKDANILLLGCGDIRNILFTAYGGAGINDRKLDFTCCDIEAEIIARNVLALTLILDDVKSSNVQRLWSIYYHVFIDTESFTLLQAQVVKLLGYAQSQRKWETSPYGLIVQFCDSATLAKVVKLWELCAVGPADKQKYNEVQDKLRQQWDLAKRAHDVKSPAGYCPLEGLRSSAPLMTQGVAELSRSYNAYWDSGTCFSDNKSKRRCRIANPMFACLRSGLVLHYDTNPPLGFHLGIGHVKLSADSPLNHGSEQTTGSAMLNDLKSALKQWEAWCAAFRSAKLSLTTRYVNCDALAFCHVLQHQRVNITQPCHWYRGCWNFDAMDLNMDYYGEHGPAPTSFDVIDTSNLMDHLGSQNLLAAAMPLLSPLPSSVLRTEMLLPREENVASSAKMLLSGDFPTMALLLGLKAVEYWTDATATWHVNESLLETYQDSNAVAKILSRHIILWKLADVQHVKYVDSELAAILLRAYFEMFQDERSASITNIKQQAKSFKAYEVYSRGGLAYMLDLIKRENVVEWDPFINKLIALILNDNSLNMGAHHLQSLFVHLDMFGLLPLERHSAYQRDLNGGPFRKWTGMPTVVCLTLVVPHSAVAIFDDRMKGYGTPICHLQVQSSVSFTKSLYSDIQLGFGTVRASGTPFTADYTISVDDDPIGWQSHAPLVVSAMVSTGSLIAGGDPACGIVFALKSTPANRMVCGTKLGMTLHIHKSFIGGQDVYVTEHRPNLTAHAIMQCALAPPKKTESDVAITITPCLDTNTAKATSLQVRYEIKSAVLQEALQSAATVDFTLRNPFTLVLNIGDTFCHELELPLPVDGARSKVRVARKSLWVEYWAPVAEPALLAARPDSVFPVIRDMQSSPVLEHLHYIQPQCLPKLYVGASESFYKWLRGCTSIACSFSRGETKIQENAWASDITNKPGRLGIKESIELLYGNIFGLGGQQKAFIFSLQASSGEIAKIFVDGVRMDVSNQTVLLDAAIIPSYPKTSTEVDWIMANTMHDQTTISHMADDMEVPFWIHLLPTFVERCRSWVHKSTCEYKVKGASIPLSSKLHEQTICTCGMGVFPDGYLKNFKQFKALRKYAVRAAIPVIYASPISSPGTLQPVPTGSAKPQAAKPKPKPKPTPRPEDLDAKKGTCFACGAKKAEKGGDLLKCSGCRFAQYCSKECQTSEWKNGHKLICKQLKE